MRFVETPVKEPVKVALAILGFTILFSVMSTFVKLAAQNGAAIIDIMFWRFAFGLIPVTLYMTRSKSFITELKHKEWPSLLARTIMGIIAMWCVFQSFTMLSLAQATTLHFTSAFFMTLLSIPLLGERVGAWRGGAIVAGFIGVLLVMRPEAGGDPIGQMIAICAAAIMAMNMLLVRSLNERVSPQGVALHLHLWGALILLPLAMMNDLAVPMAAWPYMIGAGLTAGIAQIMVNWTFMNAPPAFISPFAYIQILFVTLLGWLVFGDVPTATYYWGAGIIVASGVAIAVREALLGRKNRLEEAL